MALNEMPQDEHGYSASEIVKGRGSRLPTDVNRNEKEREDIGVEGYVKEVKKSLGQVWKEVAPRNQHPGEGENPFREGDKILVWRQVAERDHKFTPKWKGPYVVTKVIGKFQVEYEDGQGKRHSNVRYCKKYIEGSAPGLQKVFVIGHRKNM